MTGALSRRKLAFEPNRSNVAPSLFRPTVSQANRSVRHALSLVKSRVAELVVELTALRSFAMTSSLQCGSLSFPNDLGPDAVAGRASARPRSRQVSGGGADTLRAGWRQPAER